MNIQSVTTMKFYYAPMEGITLYPLRNIHRDIFGKGVDMYFTPFLTATHDHHFKNREKKDILPDRITGFEDYKNQIMPQIMAGCAEDFLWAAAEIKKLGYNEVNLNLGCPAPTIVNRKKGSGLLRDTDYLAEMLGKIFDAVPAAEGSGCDVDGLTGGNIINTSPYPFVSLKTRLGFYSDDEADDLMKIYARYPIKELIIHARVREDYYKGEARLDAFRRAVSVYRDNGGKANTCYNGNIDSLEEYQRLLNILQSISTSAISTSSTYSFPISSVMIGRGLLSNPALVRVLQGGSPLSADELRLYLNCLYDAYAEYIPEDRNVIFKMLEHWAFLHVHFEGCDKQLKAIRKSRSKGEYLAAVNNIFSSCKFV